MLRRRPTSGERIHPSAAVQEAAVRRMLLTRIARGQTFDTHLHDRLSGRSCLLRTIWTTVARVIARRLSPSRVATGA